MILILNNQGHVIAYNKVRSKESVDTSKGEVWFDGEFEFFMGENIEGKIKRYKWDGKKVVIEYHDAPTSTSTAPQPTQLDRIESMISKSQEQIAQEARDAYTLELIEGGVIA